MNPLNTAYSPNKKGLEEVTDKEEAIEDLIKVLERDFNPCNYHRALELATDYGMHHGTNFVNYAKRIIATKPKWWENKSRRIECQNRN